MATTNETQRARAEVGLVRMRAFVLGAAVTLLAACSMDVGVGPESFEDVAGAALTSTFVTTADARVEEVYPSTSFGTLRSLGVSTSPAKRAYLRFVVSGLSGTVRSATLRLYDEDGTSDGPRVFAAGSGWTETGITWSNQPGSVGAALADSGPIAANAWATFDVTSRVTGNGTYDFVLIPDAADLVRFLSRETSTRPTLVVETQIDTGCTGVGVSAGADLVAVAQSHSPGTTYCLAAGTYSVAAPIPFDRGDRWIGAPAAKAAGWTPGSATFWSVAPSTRVVSADGDPLFEKTLQGTGTTLFRALDLSGSIDKQSTGGTIGQAIGGGGQNIRIELSRIHHNGGPAVASWAGDIVDSELDHNGGAAGGQGGLKSVAGNAHAERIFFHHNVNGINCDFCLVSSGDGPFSVTNSRVTDNQAVGLKFEVSDVPAEFSGNVVLRNNLSNQDYNAGIRVLSGSNINVFDNVFGGNLRAGFRAQRDGRAMSFTNIRFHDNFMNGDAVFGCELTGVTCANNSP